jgi:diadenosine tetraphosphate (Ap4A) HIT family hydrolase
MKYQDLRDFIQNRMRMSHIYQPVMIMALLRHHGKCSVTQIAKAILAHDESQIDYYKRITNNMVGRVLRSHGIVEKEGNDYLLSGYDRLRADQIAELTTLCREKLQEYVEKRGERIFQHRKWSVGYISGTLKYEVLKRAQFHCELCGIAADIKALEVDHIIPRKHGGTDDLENLQALCYSCNAMKRDRDDTDFRKIKESYHRRESGCLFCEIPKKRIICENSLAYAVRDHYPVTPGHSLVIPRRHVRQYFDLGRPELNACNDLLDQVRSVTGKEDQKIKGFNIGVNDGETAGQSIFHCHIHLIPRRLGDVENPRGGIRHVIPGKGLY